MSTQQPTQTGGAARTETGTSDLDIDDIRQRTVAIQHMPNALINVGTLFGVGGQLAQNLREAGFSTIPDIHHNEKWKLTLVEGIGEKTARGLKAVASSRCDYHFGDYAWKPFKQHDPEIVTNA